MATERSKSPSAIPAQGRSLARQALWLGGLLAVTFVAAALGGAVTSTSVSDWYQKLNKPGWNPPDWVFGPVWSVLYALMAIAAWLVWRKAGLRAGLLALALYGLQLALNVGWSAMFFGLRSPGLAFAEILVLVVAIVATVVAFLHHSTIAGLLLIPYLAWTTFAAWLNYTIWRLNS